jgi:putative tricarboxylic transport membrane protein
LAICCTDFSVVLSWQNLLYMLIGIVLGVIIGVLPGLGGANGVAILLPLTFSMPPTSAIILLSCIYWGALFGGAITSILFNIPGEPWSVATTFDGHPMAQNGKAGEALTAAFTSSFVGRPVRHHRHHAGCTPGRRLRPAVRAGREILGVLPRLLQFRRHGQGAADQDHRLDDDRLCPGRGRHRYRDGPASPDLRLARAPERLRFLVAVIGLFGIGEILLTMEEGLSFKGKATGINPTVVLQTWKGLPRYWATSLRSCVIGCWMGITPAGATPASFMSYGIAKRTSKNGDKFGTGEIEGVIAPETAAHAAGTSALLPMLSLGVPGSPTAAVLLGGLLIWGLQPGPLLFIEQKDFVWGLIASMYLGNIVGLAVVLTMVPVFAAILRVPFSVIAPVILAICAIGAYTVHNNAFDVVMILVFGIAGYFLKKCNYPLAPLVLAIVLGDKAEEAFRQSLLISQGSLGVFWSNGLVATIMTLGLVALFWPLISNLYGRLLTRFSANNQGLRKRRLLQDGRLDASPSRGIMHNVSQLPISVRGGPVGSMSEARLVVARLIVGRRSRTRPTPPCATSSCPPTSIVRAPTSGSTSASWRRISASRARRCARRWRSSSARASCARCRGAASMSRVRPSKR